MLKAAKNELNALGNHDPECNCRIHRSSSCVPIDAVCGFISPTTTIPTAPANFKVQPAYADPELIFEANSQHRPDKPVVLVVFKVNHAFFSRNLASVALMSCV